MMGFMQRLMRLFGQPATVSGEEVDSPPEGIERRMKERRPTAPGIKVLIIDDSTTIVALLRPHDAAERFRDPGGG
jgi:hypothetical protein